MTHSLPLLAGIFGVAMLYASVGHGGASGYLAVLALTGAAPEPMRSSALLLNLLVAAISFHHFRKAGYFRSELFWPFAIASIPCAFFGGWISLPARIYSGLLAAALAAAAIRLMLPAGAAAQGKPPSRGACAAAGGGIGLLSGLVGVGGGIFLSPLMILLGWADAKETAAVSAAFIWVNSAAGLLGQLHAQTVSLDLWPLALAAVVGGSLGASIGAQRMPTIMLRRLLGAVLLIAAFKLAKGALA